MSDVFRPWQLAWGLALLAGCGAQSNAAPPAPAPTAAAPLDASAPVEARAGDAAGAEGDAASSEAEPADGSAEATASRECPEGMVLVDTSYCPKPERTCVEQEYNSPNHIMLCHKYAAKQRCLVPEEHRRFCIDEYEYPNRKGAHPAWMVSWYDGQATCASLGKRLCFASEWEAACEGPEHTPFPYGLARDNTKCNIDNHWIDPKLARVYSKDPGVQQKELSRLDQSVPSGAMPGCVSGFGVHDMTGNFDEWVTSDYPPEDKSEWAGLKGGAWGHVRNACRPMTTSHPPDFTYYFISFRCCADAPGGETFTPHGNAAPPHVDPENRAPEARSVDAPGPSKTKVPRENDGRKKKRK